MTSHANRHTDVYRSRRGFSALEVLVAISIFSVVIFVIQTLNSGGFRMTEKTGDASQSMRSVMLATEFIRFDLGRALVHDEESSIVVSEEGKRLEMSISDVPDADLSKFPSVRMSYQLEAIPGNDKGVCRLIRKTPTVSNYVKECYLTAFHTRFIPSGEISHHQAYVEVTMTGVDSPAAKDTFVSSQLMPVLIPQEPYPYALLPAGAASP